MNAKPSARLQVIGRLGADPDMRYTPNGHAVCNCRVAVDDSYKNSEGAKVERTIWFSVDAWGKAAEIINQYAHKGDMMLFDGKPGSNGWASKQEEGVINSEVTLNVDNFMFLGGGSGGGQTQAAPAGTIDEDSIPF